MLNKAIAILMLMLLTILAAASAGSAQVTTAWVRRYDEPVGTTVTARAIAVDPEGNIVVTCDVYNAATQDDILTIKYTPAGDTLWTAVYRGPGNSEDMVRALEIDEQGNIYITGISDTYGPSGDFITIKYSAQGTTLWEQPFDGPAGDWDSATDLRLDGHGHVYVGGTSHGATTSDDFLIVKYDTLGTIIWDQRYDGSNSNLLDRLYDLELDDDGNVYVTGASGGGNATVKYDPDGNKLWDSQYEHSEMDAKGAVALGVDNAGNVYAVGTLGGWPNTDYYLVKYNAYSVMVEEGRYGGAFARDDIPLDVRVLPSGDILVMGSSYGGSISNGGTLDDVVLLKFNPELFLLWEVRYDGLTESAGLSPSGLGKPANGCTPGVDSPSVLWLDTMNNMYICGYSCLPFNSYDYFTVKYDTLGTLVWWHNYNGPASEVDKAMALAGDAGGNIYVTGSSDSLGSDADYATIKLCPDADSDGICTDVDNCPTIANTLQDDTDGDGIGDACEARDTLGVAPSRIDVFRRVGDARVQYDTLIIDSRGPNSIEWTLAKAGPWMNVGKITGYTPDTVEIEVDGTGLTSGIYQGNISITSEGATASPQLVDVSMHIESGVEVSSEITQAGTMDSLDIYISHETIAGFFIPLRYGLDTTIGMAKAATTGFHINAIVIGDDYVSRGVRVLIDTLSQEIIFDRIPIKDDPLPDTSTTAPSGERQALLARMYYGVDAGTPDQIIVVDTASSTCPDWIMSSDSTCGIFYQLPNDSIVVPNFKPGYIIIDNPDDGTPIRGMLQCEPDSMRFDCHQATYSWPLSLWQIGDEPLAFSLVFSQGLFTADEYTGTTPRDIWITPKDCNISYTDTLTVDTPEAADLGSAQIVLRMHLAPGIIEINDGSTRPDYYALAQNYPNPFNSATVIEYTVPVDAVVDLAVYDILGRRVATVVNGPRSVGIYQVQWYAQDDMGNQLSSGVYFVRLMANQYSQTKRIVLLR